MARRSFLLNRFVLVFGSLALCIAAWNLYVAAHDDGHLEGLVVDAQGRPVADATVVISHKTVTSIEPLAQVRTGADGRFRFDKHGQYWLVLSAGKPGVGTAARSQLPLWFRNQDVTLDRPLTLAP